MFEIVMKILPYTLVLLVSPILGGCLMVPKILSAGERSEYFRSVDNVKKHHDDYVVSYQTETYATSRQSIFRTATVTYVRTNQRTCLMTPTSRKILATGQLPAWYKDAKQVPIRKITTSNKFTVPGERANEAAFVVVDPNLPYLVLDPKLSFHPTCLVLAAKNASGQLAETHHLGPVAEYREAWGYPVCLLTPLALAVDMACLPYWIYYLSRKDL